LAEVLEELGEALLERRLLDHRRSLKQVYRTIQHFVAHGFDHCEKLGCHVVGRLAFEHGVA